MRYTLTGITMVVCMASSSSAEPDQKGVEFFEKKIRPVLVEKCYQCHSEEAAKGKKLRGGLLVDTRDGLLKGGDSGPAVVAGKPEVSPLILAIRHEQFMMPPKGKLADDVIADFVQWVRMGAPDPRDGKAVAATSGMDLEKGRQHWAFRPLRKTAPPDVNDLARVRTPVDRFILARQSTAGIRSNEIADANALLRRAYFDLVGLPPEPEEAERFLREAEKDLPGAYTRLIDRLLASERYGERWARHWLDLARFAESNGYAFDLDRPNAYHYRDFVIRALNADMPYDRFIQLQIAGDLLAPNDYDAVSATGFIVAAPFTSQQTAKERERSRYEQLDDIIHTLATTTLGLTVGCSRCHDHKYDPLPQMDYYRLASCFAEVGYADVGLDLDPEPYRKAKAQFDAEHAPLVEARTRFEKEQLPARFEKWLANRPEELPAPGLGVWHHVGPFPAGDFQKAYDQAFPPEKKADLSATYLDGKLKWTAQPSWKDGAVHNTLTGENSANYLFRVIESPVARKVPLSLGSDDAIRVWVNGKEILASKAARGAAPDQEKVDLPLKKGRNELLMKIVNGGGPSGFYFKTNLGGPSPEIVKLLDTPEENWTAKERATLLDWYRSLDEEWLKFDLVVSEHARKEPQPKLTNIYAAKVKGTTYNFGADTFKVYFLRRGNPANKEEEAQPGFLQVLTPAGEQEKHWLSPSSAKEPSRVALAEWLTDVDRGAGHLLARVMVNRLWHHHFGRGLVATPSDFGTRGHPPSHPELLDWLAGELIREGWRLKPIHKLIMTSSVYMQGNETNPAAQKRDPENILLWRRSSRRLEAEAIRDSLLAVSGSLDLKMFGAGSLDERTPRRSIYLTVKRSRLIPFLQLFDAPDAMQGVGKREQSTVAPQALAMINSPIVHDLATRFAQRARPASTSLEDGITRAYQLAFARPPRSDELAQMKAFVEKQTASRGSGAQAEQLAFRDMCQLLLCMNEFVYVD